MKNDWLNDDLITNYLFVLLFISGLVSLIIGLGWETSKIIVLILVGSPIFFFGGAIGLAKIHRWITKKRGKNR